MVCCVSALAMVAAGCGGGAEQARPTGGVQVISPATEPEPVAEEGAVLPPVEVSAEGTEFEPPVQVAQLPDGVWYCDMGTVHYARAEAGDGTCPKCGMKLVQKAAAVEPAAEPAAEPPSGG
jgi:hypothetical protein